MIRIEVIIVAEKAIKYSYLYNMLDELCKNSWAAENLAYRNVIELINKTPEDAIVYVKNKEE